jgi:penicillin-binding protein 1A
LKFRIFGFILALTIAGAVIGGVFVLSLLPGLPDSATIRDISLKVPLRVYSSEGLLIAEFGDERRKPVAIEDTPQALRQAVLASEDDGFYRHPGIDISGIIRAALSNFQAGGSQQGASTITMQVARNYFLTPEKTYVRKIREILLALRIERTLTKDEILELYLNKIFLGHRAYGFGAAAEVYYGRELINLTLAEHAMLAGLPKAPSRDNPVTNPERATERRNYVLGRMHELGWIGDEDLAIAANSSLTAEPHRTPVDTQAPYVAEMVRAEMVEKYGESVYWEGLNVYTTIVAGSQEAAQAALRTGLLSYDRKHGFRGPIATIDPSQLEDQEMVLDSLGSIPSSGELTPAVVTEVGEQDASLMLKGGNPVQLDWEGMSWARKHLDADHLGAPPESTSDIFQPGDIVYIVPGTEPESGAALSQYPLVSGAVVSVRPEDGAILALTGGYDFYISKYNRATQAQRQPGSNIKPFIYSAALNGGFTPASQVSGAPIVIEDEYQGTVWRPENYGGKFFGPTRLRKALSLSLNLVSIRLLRSLGIPDTLDYLEQFGLDSSRLPRGLSLALGTGTITPLEMISAYSILANGGYQVTPYVIDWVEDRDQNIVYQHQPARACSHCVQTLTTREVPLETLDEPGAELAEKPTDFSYTPELAEVVEVESDELATPIEVALDTTVLANTGNTEILPAPILFDPIQEPARMDEALVPGLAPSKMQSDNNFLITSMMGDVIRVGTARRALSLNRQDLAGKTGTTNDYRDAWFSGFNSRIATSVWVGFDQPQTLGRNQTGSSAALPIWVEYMKTALDGVPQSISVPPDNVTTRRINAETSRSTIESDPDGFVEYFIVGTEPADILPDMSAPYVLEQAGDEPVEPAADLEEELF